MEALTVDGNEFDHLMYQVKTDVSGITSSGFFNTPYTVASLEHTFDSLIVLDTVLYDPVKE